MTDLLDIDRSLWASLRERLPPFRFSDPVYEVLPRQNVVLRPFEGQPRNWASPRRLPGLAVRNSSVRGAGYGIFLREKVNAGQVITLYRRKIISESTAKVLREQVMFTIAHSIDFNNSNQFLLEFCPKTGPNE
jgi:hypothetical protein